MSESEDGASVSDGKPAGEHLKVRRAEVVVESGSWDAEFLTAVSAAILPKTAFQKI